MEKILAESVPLDQTLLATDEEQYDKQTYALIARLQKLSPQELASRDTLEALDPTTATLPYLYTLNACIDAAIASGKAAPRQLPAAILPEGGLWPYITQVLLGFDPVQVRYAGDYLIKIVGFVAQGAESSRNFVPAIQLLHHVILRLDATSSTLTSTHNLFLRLCLLAQAYTEAADILDRPIYHIPAVLEKSAELRSYKYLCSQHDTSATFLTPNTGLTLRITSRSYLEYYLLAGMVYMALGQFKKAIAFFEIVLVAPTQQNTTSAVMIEAYKKWLFSYLLVHGTPPNSPRGAHQTVMRNIRAIAKPYDCVADAFKAQNPKRLRAEIEEAMDVWQDDGNYGLVLDVWDAYRKFSVQKLGKTYAAITMSEVTKQTSLGAQSQDEALAYVRALIETGSLNAIITPSKDGTNQILRFLPDTANKQSEAQVEQELLQQTRELQLLLKQISDIDHRTEITREYIDLLKKLKKVKDEDKKNGGGTRTGGMLGDDDEDMMEEF